MPGMDGTGPEGNGSMTGRGMGFCGGNARGGVAGSAGRGGRGCGNGFGRRRGSGFGGGFRFQTAYPNDGSAPVETRDEMAELDAQEKFFAHRLEMIAERKKSLRGE